MSNLTFSTKGGGEGWRSYFSVELERLCSLVPDEAGYGPQPPTPKIVDQAQKVTSAIQRDDLPLPFVVPGADGSIQLKWRKASRELSFFVFPDSIEYLTVDSNVVREGDLKPSQVNEFVDWLLSA
jgi:hypothetical protein